MAFVIRTRERREQPRLRIAFSVLVDGPFGLRRCIARDITHRGLFIETWDELPIGTELRVIFSMPDGSWEMPARCIVRHILELGTGEEIQRGVGVSFEEIEDEPTDAIEELRQLHA